MIITHFGPIAVSMVLQKQLSTDTNPCNDDPSYNLFRCVEAYFYRVNGCQFPWNVYNDLDVPVCSNYTQLHNILLSNDRNRGISRQLFTRSERMVRTKMTCLPPCSLTYYHILLEKRQPGATWRKGRSLQIILSDFSVAHKQEVLVCDTTCIVGQIGGNLGFYLGGSLLLVLTTVMDYATNALESIFKFYRRRHETSS